MRMKKLRALNCYATGVALALMAATAWCPAAATSVVDDEETVRAPDNMNGVIIETEVGRDIERSECLAQHASCKPAAMTTATRGDDCGSRLHQCLTTLPLGARPSLPPNCMSIDRNAFSGLERQGELLDADPRLLNESYISLIRARIACRAGDYQKAHNLYEEILEGVRRKPVPAAE